MTVNTYDDYGTPGAANSGRFQYTGQTYIPEVGLYNYKARFYSPTLGRFLQPDPTGYEDGLNLYSYIGNDPVNGRDPTGLARCVNCDFWQNANYEEAERRARAAVAAATKALNSFLDNQPGNGDERFAAAWEKAFGSTPNPQGIEIKDYQRLLSYLNEYLASNNYEFYM